MYKWYHVYHMASRLKKKSFKGGKSGCASTTCTWNNDQSILTTILEDDLYEATKLQTEYH